MKTCIVTCICESNFHGILIMVIWLKGLFTKLCLVQEYCQSSHQNAAMSITSVYILNEANIGHVRNSSAIDLQDRNLCCKNVLLLYSPKSIFKWPWLCPVMQKSGLLSNIIHIYTCNTVLEVVGHRVKIPLEYWDHLCELKYMRCIAWHLLSCSYEVWAWSYCRYFLLWTFSHSVLLRLFTCASMASSGFFLNFPHYAKVG